jgi:GNAT superfamily N-acetyltransferase
MQINKEIKKDCYGIKMTAMDNGEEIGRAWLYVLQNDLHAEPLGLLEDVFVEEKYRGRGIGGELVRSVIDESKKIGCYKLIATSRDSRPKTHIWYQKFGFKKYGAEFRMDLR